MRSGTGHGPGGMVIIREGLGCCIGAGESIMLELRLRFVLFLGSKTCYNDSIGSDLRYSTCYGSNNMLRNLLFSHQQFL